MSAITLLAAELSSRTLALAADCPTNREQVITSLLNETFGKLTAEINSSKAHIHAHIVEKEMLKDQINRLKMKTATAAMRGDDLLMSAMHALTFNTGSSAERSAFVQELHRRMKINETAFLP